MSHSHNSGVTVQQLHDNVKTDAIDSFHKDVMMGTLVTAMHKHGPDKLCTELPNAHQLNGVYQKVRWKSAPSFAAPPQPSQAPMQSDMSEVLQGYRQVQGAIDALSHRMDQLSVNVVNKYSPKASAPVTEALPKTPSKPQASAVPALTASSSFESRAATTSAAHVTISKASIENLLQHLEGIRAEPLPELEATVPSAAALPQPDKPQPVKKPKNSKKATFAARVAQAH